MTTRWPLSPGLFLLGVSIVSIAVLASAGCGQSHNGNNDNGDGPAATSSDFSIPPGSDLRDPGCAFANIEARQAPAAMLTVLDRSASMSMANKFTFAANAIVRALDQDVFDSMFLGLYATPASSVHGPQCLAGGLISVDCGSAPFPQVDLTLAGTQKSTDAGGVRRTIKGQLNGLLPNASDPDSTPMYDSLQAAILDLQGWPVQNGKRILFVVTDGSFSCASLAQSPHMGFTGLMDGNGCPDWEDPRAIINLLSKAHSDANTPVDTFFVGVPGADTDDPSGQQQPPYHMRLALSAMAFAGSPKNVPANCTGKQYSQQGADPAVSCHFDLTQNNFSAQAIADAIALARGKVLGCTFDLPTVDGGIVDPATVNVQYGAGGALMDIVRRADPNNQCLATPCWDYDANGKVQLIGKACTDLQNSPTVQVRIVVGCQTIIG